MKKKIDWKIVVSVIAAIVLLEGYALYKGIDGKLLAGVIAALAGIGGWSLPQLKTK